MVQISIFKIVISIFLLCQGINDGFDIQNWVGVLLLGDGIAEFVKSINNGLK